MKIIIALIALSLIQGCATMGTLMQGAGSGLQGSSHQQAYQSQAPEYNCRPLFGQIQCSPY